MLEQLVSALQAARLLALSKAEAPKAEPAGAAAAAAGEAAAAAAKPDPQEPHKPQPSAAPAPAQPAAAGPEAVAAGKHLKAHAAEVSRALRLAAEALKVRAQERVAGAEGWRVQARAGLEASELLPPHVC